MPSEACGKPRSAQYSRKAKDETIHLVINRSQSDGRCMGYISYRGITLRYPPEGDFKGKGKHRVKQCNGRFTNFISLDFKTVREK